MGNVISQGYAGATAIQVVSAASNAPPTPLNGSVTITFNDNVVVAPIAADPTAWSIVDNAGAQLQVILVTYSGQTITLITSEQAAGDTYTITLPAIGIVSALSGNNLVAPYTVTFVGQGVGPTILYSRLLDENTVEIEYSKPVIIGQAVTASNYAISGGISITAVSQVTSTIFRLTTVQKMVPNTIYIVTVFNVADLFGSPI